MKKLITVAVVLTAAWAAFAAHKLTPEQEAKMKEARARLEAMTPEERAAYRAERAMKRFGGWMVKPASGKGRVAYVNTTKKVSGDFLRKTVFDIEDLVQCSIVVQESDAKITAENASREVFRAKSEIVVFVVENENLPTMLVAPESDWAILNVTPLGKDSPDEKKFLFRVEKEVWRIFAHVCGAADSADTSCVLSPVSGLEDLDAMPSKFFCPEPQASLRRHMTHSGIEPYTRSTYLQACREGWAPAPTNDAQKAIWDKVRAIPQKPLKIEFDEKRDKGK